MSETFDQWLERATHDLPPARRERAREELTTHYHEGVRRYRVHGHAPEVAARRALADLGEARAVAHAFRRAHRRAWPDWRSLAGALPQEWAG